MSNNKTKIKEYFATNKHRNAHRKGISKRWNEKLETHVPIEPEMSKLSCHKNNVKQEH